MSSVTIAVDLAKNVFELAVPNASGRITERKWLSHPQFEVVVAEDAKTTGRSAAASRCSAWLWSEEFRQRCEYG